MKILRLLAILLAFPLACLAASTPVNNGIMSGTLTFNQSATVGLIPWANIGLTAGALPGVNSITAGAGSTLTLTTGALGIQINANGSLVFPYNAQAGLVEIDGSGNISPFANGVNGTVLTMSGGTPTWGFNATGNVSNSGTPSAGQLAQWVDATHIAGVTAINPASIGATTPGTGAFTTLSASSTVGGAGFSTYLASPPAIGGTSPAAGAFTTISASSTSSFTGIMTVSAVVNWASGVRQTFNPNGTTPGFNPGSNAGDPASPSNGDMWYDSTNNLYRICVNGSSVSIGSSGVSSITGTAGQVLANGTSGSAQINGVTMTLASSLTGINAITAAASNSMTLTAGSGGNFNIVLTPTGSGNVQDSSTTASTSTITGAFVDSGGMGVAGAIWAGSINVTSGAVNLGSGTTTVGTLTASSTSTLTGVVTVGGGGTSGNYILWSGTTGAAPQGSIGLNAATGLTLTGKTGSGSDFHIGTAVGPIMDVPTTTQNVLFYGNLSVTGTSTLTGNVTFGGSLISAGSLVLGTNGSTTALTLDTSQNATFAGTIKTIGGATFHTTSTSLSNGAGSSAGTLTTAPSVGNPTKWIGINDNGTTRYIPAW